MVRLALPSRRAENNSQAVQDERCGGNLLERIAAAGKARPARAHRPSLSARDRGHGGGARIGGEEVSRGASKPNPYRLFSRRPDQQVAGGVCAATGTVSPFLADFHPATTRPPAAPAATLPKQGKSRGNEVDIRDHRQMVGSIKPDVKAILPKLRSVQKANSYQFGRGKFP